MALSLRCKRLHRLTIPGRQFLRPCSTVCPEKKGLVLGVYSDDENGKLELTSDAVKYNEACQGKLVEQLNLAGKVKAGKSFLFWGVNKDFQAVAVVGLGKKNQPRAELELIDEDKENARVAAAAGCRALDATGIKTIQVENLGHADAAAEGSLLSTWKFQEYKTKKETLPEIRPFTPSDKWSEGSIKAEAQNLARSLADTPSNLMTPTIFALTAYELLTPLGLSVQIRDQDWAQNQKMGAFLAVAQGSCQPPKFLEISYEKGDGLPMVLVGKGVTFDTGGISLKPASLMDQMRADMSGAANVLGTLYGLAKLGVPVNIKALIPLTENMPSGEAIKPGDVVIARNGKSICIDNTDAEGRLILADALSYSEVFKPRWVLDIATLTGAIAVALGGSASGVFANSNELYQKLENAGSSTGDRVWRMPLWKYYTKQMTENVAYDINNISKAKGGGSCTAAAFLREFIPEKTPWIHVDMAGVMGPTDTTPYLGKGMTGRPTRTLIDFIRGQAK